MKYLLLPLFSIFSLDLRSLAIVTHKGAAADAGHYIGFAKKSVFHPQATDDDEDWYKFDDDKVSIFPGEKLPTLEGGGECLLLWGCITFVDKFRRGFLGVCATL